MAPKRTPRRLLAAVAAALLAALVAAPSASAGLIFPESGGSPNADSIHTLYVMVFVLALIVFVVVEGALVYSFFKFKARRGDVAAQIHGNTRLEIGWTVGAAVILVVITVVTFIKLPAIKDPKGSAIDQNGNAIAAGNVALAATDIPQIPKGPRLQIHVDGQQYVWRYQYPGTYGPGQKVFSYVDMVVPVGMTVLLDITADDVAHSWWIPKLGGKMDAVPGYTNRTWFQIPLNAIPKGAKSIVYPGQCAELCGRNHANMYARVIGMRYADWKSYMSSKANQIKQAQVQGAQQRKALEQAQGAQASQGGGGGSAGGQGPSNEAGGGTSGTP